MTSTSLAGRSLRILEDEPIANVRNRLLQALSRDDRQLLQPHLQHATLPARQRLETAGATIKKLYFIEDGLASIVAAAGHAPTHEAQIALIGRDGMTGVAVLHGSKRAGCDIVMQIAGNGWSIDADVFRQLQTLSPTLTAPLQLYAHVLGLQGTYTALANGCGTIEERLARLLLMAADRLEAELDLTHELLGRMLGVQRPGITIALQGLKARGGISTARGRIVVCDRRLLEKSANGFYGRPEIEFQRLLH